MPEMANWMVGMRNSWKDKLSKNRPALCKGIDPEPNLFSHLESLTIFNKRTCKTIAVSNCLISYRTTHVIII